MPTCPGPSACGWKKTRSPGCSCSGRDALALEELPGRVVVERDAELAVDVHRQPRAVEAAGRRGPAPHVRDAEIALRDRDGLRPQHAAVARAHVGRAVADGPQSQRRGTAARGRACSAMSVFRVIHMRVACTSSERPRAEKTSSGEPRRGVCSSSVSAPGATLCLPHGAAGRRRQREVRAAQHAALERALRGVGRAPARAGSAAAAASTAPASGGGRPRAPGAA